MNTELLGKALPLKPSRPAQAPAPRREKRLGVRVWNYRYFYMMVIPVLVWYAIFCYLPMYGITLAFKTYTYKGGIFGSPWVGLAHFAELFQDTDVLRAVKNSLVFFLGTTVFCFPAPIILALLLNEVLSNKVKRVYQTVLTFPHFLSWVVMAGIITNILSTDGVFNQIVRAFGGQETSLLTQFSAFRPVIYITQIGKEVGWGSIVYLAAIAGINPELYEASEIDGANRFQRMAYVTWPGIKSAVAILFILQVSSAMSAGGTFDQIINLYNAAVYPVADTIDTYIYRISFTVGGDFGYMSAVGFVESVVNFILLVMANWIIKLSGESGIF